MKISLIAIILCVSMDAMAQITSLEKQALAAVQRMPASDLGAELPKRPFQIWFNQLTGPQAGVVWQLTECGERIVAPGKTEIDMPACVEVNASLPNGRKVIIAIAVGTFKKGLIGNPSFFRAVLEWDEQLFMVPRLIDLPEALFSASTWKAGMDVKNLERQSVNLSQLNVAIYFPFRAAHALPTNPNSNIVLTDLSQAEIPPLLLTPPQKPRIVEEALLRGSALNQAEPPPLPPASPQEMQTVEEGLLQGSAITKVKPNYPPSARKMNALGPVEVQIMISEDGLVVDARAVSGHLALRGAAVEAAYKWIFRPTKFNGQKVKVQGILTFIFSPGEK